MISAYIISAAGYAVVFAIIYMICRATYIKKLHKSAAISKELAKLIFFSYLAGLLSQTILPLWQCGFMRDADGPIFYFHVFFYGESTFNLIPFRTIYEYLFTNNMSYSADEWTFLRMLNLMANVFLFVPFGALLPLVFDRMKKFRNVLLCGICLSVFIEIVQIFIKRGTDIDDVILNTVGVTIGYVIYFGINKLRFLILKKKID